MTMRAMLNGVVIAESDDIRTIVAMRYFPRESVDMSRLIESPYTSRCLSIGDRFRRTAPAASTRGGVPTASHRHAAGAVVALGRLT